MFQRSNTWRKISWKKNQFYQEVYSWSSSLIKFCQKLYLQPEQLQWLFFVPDSELDWELVYWVNPDFGFLESLDFGLKSLGSQQQYCELHPEQDWISYFELLGEQLLVWHWKLGLKPDFGSRTKSFFQGLNPVLHPDFGQGLDRLQIQDRLSRNHQDSGLQTKVWQELRSWALRIFKQIQYIDNF